MPEYYSGNVVDNHRDAIEEASTAIETDLFIGGKFRQSEGGDYFETVDPTVKEPIAEIARGQKTDVDAAVSAAADAADEWGDTVPPERQEVLRELAERIEDNVEEFTLLESLDSGKPLDVARGEVERAAEFLDYYAGVCRSIEGKQLPYDSDALIYTRREPYGVVGQIIPWNFPLVMVAYKLGPALATGNTVVMKPAEQTPLTALRLAREAQDVVPDGVFNVVTGFGEEAGQPLTEHPEVRKLAFTGETTTGHAIMKSAAERAVPVTLELGGKSPFIVFPDGDLDVAVESVAGVMYYNTGQSCDAPSRVFVHDDVREEFMEKFIERTHEEVVGDPLREGTTMGPLASEAQFDKVTSYLDVGRDEGATVETGGGIPESEDTEHGYFVEPTVFAEAQNDFRIAQEEIFGPVETVISWSDYDEMIRQANDTEFGLAAGMATNDVSLANQTAEKLEAGNVWVNKYATLPPGTPFGGYKQSGIGREHTRETLLAYTRCKTVDIDTTHSPM
ncbi:aldehyde dehydrogenase family protein [Haloarculaceae archaeon H-GB2-1]|nr:aldehyde dehydrogenase family protein [Haloarculaceae archaeon H-GB1-1]MEA5408793.1 aldehyde dehydrogenase family protein [Haloarculaceae archaeon H-GB2-1]